MATACPPAAKLVDCRVSGGWLLPIILLAALVIRLPGVTRPLVGNFATRNVVQAMEARNWMRGVAPWWRPTLDTLADGERAWHLVEVPCSAYLSGMLWATFGGSLDAWGRATSIGWSLLSVAILFHIAERRLGSSSAVVAALGMALAPIGIIYGQSFLLEPSVVAFALLAWWSAENYATDARPRWLLVFGVSLALLWLSKIYMLAIALPLMAILWQASILRAGSVSARSDGRFRDRTAYLVSCTHLVAPLTAMFLATLPVAWWAWQVWQLAAPGAATSGRVYYSFLSSAAEHRFPHPLLASPGFYVHLARDLFTVVLTPIGALLVLAGAARVDWRRWWPLVASGIALVIVMPRKFHEMNYYHLLLLPAWCAMLPLGWRAVAPWFERRPWRISAVMAIALACSLRYSVRPAFVTPAEDRSVVAASVALQAVAAPGDRVVAAHGSSLDLLYYCDRAGWALDLDRADVAEQIADKQTQGARWLVVAGEESLPLPVTAEQTLCELPLVRQGWGYRVYALPAAGDESRAAAMTAMPKAPGTR